MEQHGGRRLTELAANPGPHEALTSPRGDGPPTPAAKGTPTRPDLGTRLAQLQAGHDTSGDGGPWVHHGATAVDEAAGARPAGPLDPAVVAVKDLIAVAGLPVGAGTRARADAPPEPRDAAIVRRLRDAGAVIAGTVALHELAFGVTGVNDQVGFPVHPADRGRVPGGSSSGSAVAVAQGTADLALGTDTGGSIRIPAALCGVVGFKPARGTYPLDGVLALAPSLDHVGLFARTVAQVVQAHGALTDTEPATAPSDAGPLRLALDHAGLEAAEPAVAEAVEAALRRLRDAGCELVDLARPDPVRVIEVSTTLLLAEAATVHRTLVAEAEDQLGAGIAARLRAGAEMREADHAAAVRDAAEITAASHAGLRTVDALVGPTVPLLAPTIDAGRADDGLTPRLVSNTRLGNLTGLPALSLPVPGAELPVGLQIVSASNEQALHTAAHVERLLAADKSR